ncbi:GNAT family N-acetyltransferase [Pseudoalteromonas denitrificans]|uniref:ElaA protein n=1 Tax=Pseudoalteromonas denitrificans DSM 6059 TaxID=1123010 RepID=A0A1I1F0W0_9GAMM|nr:GNAT family N-acetyltransferase [Pseudoalteromonas denitrificans]SFB91398.1 ElaA protein [Pseudoalteromonas denitrificans DSM 6059]
MLNKITKSFNELTTNELYQSLKLRVDVFVVEQNCVYPELDDLDMHEHTRHVLIYDDEELLAYARCLAPKTVFTHEPAIGRVVVSKLGRGKGLAKELMLCAIKECELFWPEHMIKISAQTYLLFFYQSLGLEVVGDAYLEDGIEHQDMIKRA